MQIGCRLCHIQVEDDYHFTCKCSTYINIREKYKDILGPSLTLSQLLDTSHIKTLGMYILELKRHRENKLQNDNHNLSSIIHQHTSTYVFQGLGEDDVVVWLAQKRSVAQTKDNVKVRKESLGFGRKRQKEEGCSKERLKITNRAQKFYLRECTSLASLNLFHLLTW